jgi:isoleucyl-tRNA synthetase
VRDLVRGIQNLRKERGLAVTDRIVLTLDGPDSVRIAVERFKDHLLAETLAVSCSLGPAPRGTEIECGDGTVRAAIEKAPA